MRLREILVYPEILQSRKVCSLKPFAQLFYRNLMHVCDGAGIFENDPEMLCRALYPRALDRVTPQAVATWLMECQQAGLIGLHTDDRGRALGEFTDWLQKDLNRKRRFQSRREQPPEELAGLYAADDPPKKLKKGRGGKKDSLPFPSLHFSSSQKSDARPRAAEPTPRSPLSDLPSPLRDMPHALGRMRYVPSWILSGFFF